MKTFKIAALLPHGNIQTVLQQEQNSFCRKADVIKATPFLLILEKLEADSPSDSVLAGYSELFQSLKSVPELSPLKIAHFRAFRNINDEISLRLSEETFKVGSFLYKPGELLYGTAEKKARTEAETNASDAILQFSSALPAQNEKIQLKVFQLAVFSITQEKNLVTWHAEAAKWMRF